MFNGNLDRRRLDSILAKNGVRGGDDSKQKVVAVEVEFKRGRKERFSVRPDLAAECAKFNGPFCIWVESNPGEDLGTVVMLLGPNSAGDLRSMKRALRLATDRDKVGFKPKAEAERQAIDFGNQVAREMRLPLRIDDAEFQVPHTHLIATVDMNRVGLCV